MSTGRCKFVVMSPTGREIYGRFDVSSRGFKLAVQRGLSESKGKYETVDINMDCGGAPGYRHSGIFLLTCVDGKTCDVRHSQNIPETASAVRIAGVGRRRQRRRRR